MMTLISSRPKKGPYLAAEKYLQDWVLFFHFSCSFRQTARSYFSHQVICDPLVIKVFFSILLQTVMCSLSAPHTDNYCIRTPSSGWKCISLSSTSGMTLETPLQVSNDFKSGAIASNRRHKASFSCSRFFASSEECNSIKASKGSNSTKQTAIPHMHNSRNFHQSVMAIFPLVCVWLFQILETEDKAGKPSSSWNN